MFFEVPVLVTERLRLREFRGSDLADYAALNADPEVLRYLPSAGREPWDLGRTYRHLAFLLGHWHLAGCGVWAVEQKGTGSFIGMVGFSEPAGWPGCELSWKLVRRWWGHGYATEAARAALDHAFSFLRKDRVISLIHPENRASIRVAERIGETLQGAITHFGFAMLCYGIDRESGANSAWKPSGTGESSHSRARGPAATSSALNTAKALSPRSASKSWQMTAPASRPAGSVA